MTTFAPPKVDGAPSSHWRLAKIHNRPTQAQWRPFRTPSALLNTTVAPAKIDSAPLDYSWGDCGLEQGTAGCSKGAPLNLGGAIVAFSKAPVA